MGSIKNCNKVNAGQIACPNQGDQQANFNFRKHIKWRVVPAKAASLLGVYNSSVTGVLFWDNSSTFWLPWKVCLPRGCAFDVACSMWYILILLGSGKNLKLPLEPIRRISVSSMAMWKCFLRKLLCVLVWKYSRFHLGFLPVNEAPFALLPHLVWCVGC